MQIIKDERKQLNLHPLVIYFFLYNNEPWRSAEVLLNRLNRDEKFTRGIFEFKLVYQSGDYVSKDVSAELLDSIKAYNMLVRLVDDNSDCFYYAVHKVDFNLSEDIVERLIQDFVVDVCDRNIWQLEPRNGEYTQQEGLMTVRRIQQIFHEAMLLENLRQVVRKKIYNYKKAKMLEPCMHYGVPEEFEREFNKASKNNDAEYLWEWVQSHTGALDKSESDEIARGCYDVTHSSAIRRDKLRRTKPEEMPDISVSIERVVTELLADGKEKKEYAFVFTINGQVSSIRFSSKAEVMIYTCTLLRLKMGEKMYLHEFHNNSKGNSCRARFKQGGSGDWLKAVYDTLFPNNAMEFNDWIGGVARTHGRPLNQGKSNLNRKIGNTFKSMPSAVYYCSVNTRKDEIDDSFYDIMIPAEKISIPEAMQFLIDDFNQLMGL